MATVEPSVAFDFERLITPTRLAEFSQLVRGLAEQIGFPVSSRGWCYILEQAGLITKAHFDKVERWVNTARRRGMLPIDLVAEEVARRFKGIEVASEGSPVDMIEASLSGALNAEVSFGVDWWAGEDHYIQMVVEKVDLVTLFHPVCRKYHIPIANAAGWSSMLQRADYARRFEEAEQAGLKPVLMYCGDHDPDGLRISDTLRKNLRDLQDIEWKDGTPGYDPRKLNIVRFGLEYDFITEHGFTWIDNLITGSGRNLADPNHKNHGLPYVQNYLSDVGARKCEANVLVTLPDVARDLCREAIEAILGEDALQRFAARRQAMFDYVAEFRQLSGIDDAIYAARNITGSEGDLMEGKQWTITE